MSPEDSLALTHWAALYKLGFWLVWVGVVIEAADLWLWSSQRNTPHAWNEPWTNHVPGRRKLTHFLERLGWILLVIGLVVEEFSHDEIEAVREHVSWSQMAMLGNANRIAGKAHERAAIAELQLKDRRITMEQMTNFTFLAERIEKIPIRIVCASRGGESGTFASDLRQMFNQAGFATNSTDADIGFEVQERLSVITYFLSTNTARQVRFVMYSTNKHWGFDHALLFENGAKRRSSTFPFKDQLSVYQAIAWCFEQIGVGCVWLGDDALVKPGECAIVIGER